jgi:acyl-CoA thioesterase
MPKQVPRNVKGFNPFADLVGLQVVLSEHGRSQCTLVVSDTLLNPYKVLHGGVLYTLADVCMASALYAVMDENEMCATIEIKISYFAPVREGAVVCDAIVTHKTKRFAFLEAELKNDNRVVAKTTGTFAIMQGR